MKRKHSSEEFIKFFAELCTAFGDVDCTKECQGKLFCSAIDNCAHFYDEEKIREEAWKYVEAHKITKKSLPVYKKELKIEPEKLYKYSRYLVTGESYPYEGEIEGFNLVETFSTVFDDGVKTEFSIFIEENNTLVLEPSIYSPGCGDPLVCLGSRFQLRGTFVFVYDELATGDSLEKELGIYIVEVIPK